MGYDGANGEQHFRESIENTLKQEIGMKDMKEILALPTPSQ